jgi:hypothetical protein
LFRCDSGDGGGCDDCDSGEGGGRAFGDCDSEVVLEEEGWGCDDCDSRSGGEGGNLDGRLLMNFLIFAPCKLMNQIVNEFFNI